MKKKYIIPSSTTYTFECSRRMLDTSPTSPNVGSDPADLGKGGNYGKEEEEFGW